MSGRGVRRQADEGSSGAEVEEAPEQRLQELRCRQVELRSLIQHGRRQCRHRHRKGSHAFVAEVDVVPDHCRQEAPLMFLDPVLSRQQLRHW